MPLKKLRSDRKQVDPIDPANADKTLAELDALEDGYDLGVDALVDPQTKPAFWDHEAIAALCFGVALGSIAGVPIGLYLFRSF